MVSTIDLSDDLIGIGARKIGRPAPMSREPSVHLRMLVVALLSRIAWISRPSGTATSMRFRMQIPDVSWAMVPGWPRFIGKHGLGAVEPCSAGVVSRAKPHYVAARASQHD